MQRYTLTIDSPLRPVSTTVRARDDTEAVRTAADLVSATCSTLDDLDKLRTRLTRSDGSDVYRPTSIALLVSGTIELLSSKRFGAVCI